MSELEVDTRTDDELDSIADGIEQSTNRSREMEMKPSEPDKSTAAATPSKEEYEFVHNGKQVKGTRDQIIKWAQMGYDRPQVAQKWNKEKAEWEAKRQTYSEYEKIDEFAKTPQGKEWFEHINNAWKNRGNFQPGVAQPLGSPGVAGQSGAIAQIPESVQREIQTLKQTLEGIQPTLSQLMQEKQEMKNSEEDKKLESEIQSIRKSNKDLDWESLDENGESLELRVLKHADTLGFAQDKPDAAFRAAFRDLLHDQLVGKAESQGKIAVSKGIQAKTKLGVLGSQPTSSRMPASNNKDIRKQSYEDVHREVLEELRAGKY